MNRNIRKMTILTIIAGLALVMMAVSGSKVINTRAALNPSTATYNGNIALTKIVSVGVVEEGELSEDMQAGKKYEEKIGVANTTDVDEYVRLIVKKYWKDADNNKVQLKPGLIELRYDSKEYNDSAWIKNDAESTKEQEVYYLNKVLEKNKESELLFNSIRISEKLAQAKTVTEKTETAEDGTKVTVITEEYQYNGYKIVLELEAQSVQIKHAEDAANSIWGNVGISIDEDAGTVSK